MKTTDRIFAWVPLVLGCVHCAMSFVLHRALNLDTIWFLSGGLVLIFGALLNLMRIARPHDRLLARASALANLLLLTVFVAAVPWLLRHELKQNPQVVVLAIAVAMEFGFSLRQCFR